MTSLRQMIEILEAAESRLNSLDVTGLPGAVGELMRAGIDGSVELRVRFYKHLETPETEWNVWDGHKHHTHPTLAQAVCAAINSQYHKSPPTVEAAVAEATAPAPVFVDAG